MPQALDEISVMIVDSQPSMRSQLRAMLGICGITNIALSVSAGAAIRKLREATYDIILCEYHLGEGQDGQHLLEDLRNHQVIPLSTIFIMITGESAYERVVSAVELAPNDYVLKPFSADILLDRLAKALTKRDVFLPTYKRIEAGNLLDAIEVCKRDEVENPGYLIDFLRLRAELYLATSQTDLSQEIYQRVVEMRAVPWAKLGLAKTQYLQKRYDEAQEGFNGLIAENANYMDAYDWLARTREAMGELESAQETLQAAIRVSPHTTRRLRKLGEVSNELGDHTTAAKTMAEVVRKGKYSDFRDPEDHVQLIKAHLGQGDTKSASAAIHDLERSMHGLPKTPLCKALSSALVATKNGDTAAAAAALDEAAKHSPSDLGTSTGLKKDLARVCIEHKRDDQASGVIMEIMRHAADDSAVEDIKNLLVDLGRPELGEELATQVRSEVKNLMSEGAQLAAKGDYTGAVMQMRQAATRLPGNTNVLFNAALALLKYVENVEWEASYAQEARNYIERVRKQDPGNERLKLLTNYFHALLKKNGVRPGDL